MPIRIGLDTLAVHAARTTKITRGIETGDGRVVDPDFAFKDWAVVERDRWGVAIRKSVKLLVQKALQELGELWLVDMCSQRCDLFGISTFCLRNNQGELKQKEETYT
jgi:hypothetical protein